MPDAPETTSQYVKVKDTRVHYLACGDGPPVIMLHGWPTSAHLWRDVLPIVGKTHRAIAIDLPGYGWSDKPPGTRYSFPYYERILDGFLAALDIPSAHLVVHDLGGPVGVFWALRHPGKVDSLTLLNTLVYPEVSWAVKVFMVMLRLPGLRNWISSPSGIRFSIKLGVVNKKKITDEVMRGYLEPFDSKEAREGLLMGGQGLSLRGFREIAEKLPGLDGPVRCIYGEQDRILPDVAETMRRVKKDLPQAEVTSLPGCGHFLHEDDAEKVGSLIVDFLNSLD